MITHPVADSGGTALHLISFVNKPWLFRKIQGYQC